MTKKPLTPFKQTDLLAHDRELAMFALRRLDTMLALAMKEASSPDHLKRLNHKWSVRIAAMRREIAADIDTLRKTGEAIKADGG
jgi:hypothetical protein